MVQSGWRHLPHDADVEIEAWGPELARAFEQAAIAMTAVITDPDTICARDQIVVTLESKNPERLLFDWLNALVYEMDTRRMLFARFCVQIDENGLRADVWGERLDVTRHAPAVGVKGATYTNLHVRWNAGRGWVVNDVVDV